MASRSLSRNAPAGLSPFAVEAAPLSRAKFADPQVTADGSLRAKVALWLEGETLHGTLWRAGLPKSMRQAA